jgi:hypothetical protein
VLAVFASSARAQTSVVTHIGYVFPSISRSSLDSSRAAGAQTRASAGGVNAQLNVATHPVAPVATYVGTSTATYVEIGRVQSAPTAIANRAQRIDDDHRGCKQRRDPRRNQRV